MWLEDPLQLPTPFYVVFVTTILFGLLALWTFYNSLKFARVNIAKANGYSILWFLCLLLTFVFGWITFHLYQEIQEKIELQKQNFISTECIIKDHAGKEYFVHIMGAVSNFDGYLLLEYNANGTTWEEYAVAFTGDFSIKFLENKMNLLYPKNSTIICFYMESDPKKIFIENPIKYYKSVLQTKNKKEL